MKTEELLKPNTTHQMVDHSFYNCLAKSFLIVQLFQGGCRNYIHKKRNTNCIFLCAFHNLLQT